MKRLILTLIIMAFFLIASGFSQKDKVLNKDFNRFDKIKVKLVLGGCELEKSKDDKVHVRLTYSYPDDQYEAVFKEKSKSLYIAEKFPGRNPEGESFWQIAIPDNVELDFNSATGALTMRKINAEIDANSGTGKMEIIECQGEFEINSGTGRVNVEGSTGEFDLNSGTGSVEIENSSGNFDANSGTGDVEARNLTFEDEGEFNSGTGDVEVIGPRGDNYTLSINSGTNDAILDMDGLPVKGYFELSANKRRGRIISDIKFDLEKEYDNGDGKYLKKSFTRGEDTPRFFIGTGTGRAEFKK